MSTPFFSAMMEAMPMFGIAVVFVIVAFAVIMKKSNFENENDKVSGDKIDKYKTNGTHPKLQIKVPHGVLPIAATPPSPSRSGDPPANIGAYAVQQERRRNLRWAQTDDGDEIPEYKGVPTEVNDLTEVLVRWPKTRVAYVLFAIFFGPLGVHNFYALRSKAATTQFLMTVLSLGLLSPISGIWALIDICTVEYDGNGNPLE